MRESRAVHRREWPVRVFQLGDEPRENLSASTTPQERLAMVWTLTLDAWSLSRRPLPEYERRDAPVRRLPIGHSS
jgi:hypothetical protein